MTAPTFQQIKKKYEEDRAQIKVLRAQAEEAAAPILAQIAQIEKYQKAREDYLVSREDIEAFEFITDLYLNGRNDKAEAKKAEQNIGMDMKKLEDWLLKMLSKVGTSIATKAGTVYRTRKESVGVADFDAYLASEILAPIATGIFDALNNEELPCTMEGMIDLLQTWSHVEALTRAANKSYVLEKMGDQAEDGSRPNTPPPGIDYKAFAAVGVRNK